MVLFAALGLFILYQRYQLTIRPSAGLIVLTVFDALIVFLTWHEYQRHRRRASP